MTQRGTKEIKMDEKDFIRKDTQIHDYRGLLITAQKLLEESGRQDLVERFLNAEKRMYQKWRDVLETERLRDKVSKSDIILSENEMINLFHVVCYKNDLSIPRSNYVTKLTEKVKDYLE